MPNSIRAWLKSNYTLVLILGGVIFTCIIIFLYGMTLDERHFNYIPVFNSTESSHTTEVLTDNHTIIQELHICDNPIQGISIRSETYGTHILDGKLYINVYDSNSVLVYSDEYFALEIFDDQYYDILFNNFKLLPNANYTLEIKFSEISEQKLSFYLSEPNQYTDLKTYINDTEIDRDIILNFISENTTDSFQRIYSFTMISLVIIECIATVLLLKSKVSLNRIYIVIVTCIGLFYLLFFPLHVVPDEPVHNWSAYSVANIFLGREDTAINTIVMRADDYYSSFQPTNLTRSVFNNYWERFPDFFVNDATLVETEHKALEAPAYLYFFSGLGIAIGQLLHFNTIPTYLLGRLFNLVMFVIAVQYSIKKIPFGKALVFLWAILPMTLHEVASLSYDAPLYTLSVIIISLTLNIMYDKKNLVIDSKLILLFICILLLAPTKGFALIPICFLPTIWLFNKEKCNKKTYSYLLSLIFSAIIICLFFKLTLYDKPEAADAIVNTTDIVNRGYSITYLLSNPQKLFLLLCNTIYSQIDFYLNSFLGYSLGWFELYMPTTAILPYFILMALGSMVKTNEDIYIIPKIKIVFLLISLLSFAFAVGGMLIGFTPVGIDYIQGVQGRYCIPFAIISFLILRTPRIRIHESIENKIVLSGIYLQYIVIFCMFRRFI